MKQEVVQKFRPFKKGVMSSRSGQAMVEYLLIVFVMVAFIMLLKNSFKSAQNFVSGYVGDYTACLMEYGELPSLGIDNDELNKHVDGEKVCNAKFEGFTLANGRPAKSTTDSSATTSQAEKDAAARAAAQEKANRNKSSNGDGGAGGSGGAQRGGARVTDGRAFQPGKTRVIEVDEEDDGDTAKGASRGSRSRRYASNSGYRAPYRSITGEEAEKILAKSQPRSAARDKTPQFIKNEETFRPGPRRSPAKVPPERDNTRPDNDRESAWGVGAILKWLLIIVMIVLILVFVGGQIFSYNNSEK